MDPLSLAASITALLQLTATVVGYLNDVKDASKDRAKVTIEVANVLGLLTCLQYRVKDAKSDDAWYDAIRVIGAKDGALEQYHSALEQLASKLAPGKGIKSLGRALIWSFEKKEMNDIISRIERLKTLISLALENDLL